MARQACELHQKPCSHVPSNVAVECPDSRVVSDETDASPTVSRESKCVSARGIGERNVGDIGLVIPIALAEDPKVMAMKMEPISQHQTLVSRTEHDRDPRVTRVIVVVDDHVYDGNFVINNHELRYVVKVGLCTPLIDRKSVV